MSYDPTGCACRCGCPWGREPDCDRLCERCWRAWCEGDQDHAPVADASYMGTYGLGNIWVTWVMSLAPELVAERADFFRQSEPAPRCPACIEPTPMVRRPGGWKCYRHDEAVVVLDKPHLPRAPRAKVLETLGTPPPRRTNATRR